MLLTEMNEIVQFTLQNYGVRAKWRIIRLTYNNWRKLAIEETLIDEFHLRSIDHLRTAIATEEAKRELERDDALREKIYERFRMERELRKEYGRELSLEEYLFANAVIIVVKGYVEPPLAPKRLRRKCPFVYTLAGQNKDVDFLILLNLSMVCGNSRRENLTTVAHETLHYIQALSNRRSMIEFIENQAEGIVDQFLENKGI